MSRYQLGDDCPSNVRELIEEYSCDWNGTTMLVDYDTNLLIETLEYINKKGTHALLRRQIETELKQREMVVVPGQIDKKTALWLEPIWWAVMSLFDKGEMKRSDPSTKALLNRVKPEWKYNCGGR